MTLVVNTAGRAADRLAQPAHPGRGLQRERDAAEPRRVRAHPGDARDRRRPRPAADAVRRALRAHHGDHRAGARGQLRADRRARSSGRARRKAADPERTESATGTSRSPRPRWPARPATTPRRSRSRRRSRRSSSRRSPAGSRTRCRRSAEERLAEQAGAQSDVAERPQPANPTRSTEPWHPASGPSPAVRAGSRRCCSCLGIAAGFAALGQWQLSRSVENVDTEAPDTEVPVPLASIAEPQTEVTQPQLGRRVTRRRATSSPADFIVLTGRNNGDAATGRGWSGIS